MKIFLRKAEHKKKGEGVIQVTHGYWMLWSGMEERESVTKRLTLIFKEQRVTNTTNKKFLNERIIKGGYTKLSPIS